MKKLLLCLLLIPTLLPAKDNLTEQCEALMKEGKTMYRSEMASWYGTDVFLEKFKSRKINSGGYFSYSDYDKSTCVFFSKSEDAKVIWSITFDTTYNINTALIDSVERPFTDREKDLYIMRKKTVAEIDKDTLFETYKNTSLNVIPEIYNGEHKVYILTGPQENGVLIFGNDYVLTFDKKNNLMSKHKIHQNIIVTDLNKDIGKDQKVEAGIHSHLASTGDLITATDICTLMLYEKLVKIEQYYVISQKYVSIWNCKTDQLVAITREAWDKIADDQEMRKNKKVKN